MITNPLRLLLAAWLLSLAGVAPAEDNGAPNPLGLQRALGYAESHPRVRLRAGDSHSFPRRQPLYLDCHRVAYSSTSGIDNQRNRPSDFLVDSVTAQQLEILERFFDVLLADLSYTRYNESMAVAYVQFDRASSRRELGQYSELQVVELEVAYQDVLRRRAASEVLRRLTRSMLAQAIGHPRDLPRDLIPPEPPTLPEALPELDDLVGIASRNNRWIVGLKETGDEAARLRIDIELRQQLLELLLRLQALKSAEKHVRAVSEWRDLRLEESRTLYEQEVKADLGFSMSQQTKAWLEEQRVAYCRAMAWAEQRPAGKTGLAADPPMRRVMKSGLVCLLLVLITLPAHGVVQLKAWLEWVHKVEMRVVESGVVDGVAVSAGQRVKQGDLLLRMDQREFQARLLEMRARVARALIKTEKAQRELDRAKELFGRGLIAQEELKDAELEMAAAIAEEESDRAAEAVAEVALERTELRAPFDGVIVARNVWQGEVIYKTLQQEPPLIIAPDDKMLARALVTANVIRRYTPGQPAKVNILGKLRDARIYSLGVEPVRVELQGAVYYLDLIFDLNSNESLRPSETVQIVLP